MDNHYLHAHNLDQHRELQSGLEALKCLTPKTDAKNTENFSATKTFC